MGLPGEALDKGQGGCGSLREAHWVVVTTERSSVAITFSEDGPVETWGCEMVLCMAQWSRLNIQQRFYKALGCRHNHYITREMAGFFPACTRPFLGFLLVLCRLGVLCGREDRGKHKRIKMDLLRWRF